LAKPSIFKTDREMKDDYEKFNENRLSLNTDIKMTSSGALDSKDSYDRPSSKLSDDGFSI